MTTIEELKARHAAEIAAEKRRVAIAALLPVVPTFVCIHSDHVSAKYAKRYPEKYSFAEAMALIDSLKLAPVTSEHWKSGCISCRPAAINEYAKQERATLDASSAYELELGAGPGYETHELSFWAQVGTDLCEIGIEIRPRWKWLPQTEFRYDRNGEVTTNKISACGIGEDTFRKYWSSPGSYKLSYFWADEANFRAWASHEIEAEGAK